MSFLVISCLDPPVENKSLHWLEKTYSLVVSVVLVESDMFSVALTASSNKEHRKKKSRRSSSGSAKDDGKKDGDEASSKHRKSKSPPKATSPLAEVKPPKFYRDTLEEPENQPKSKIIIQDLKKKTLLIFFFFFYSIEAESEEEEDEETAGPPKVKLHPEGILVVSRSRRAPKKSIRWRGETDLVSIKYFDLDENERVNVTRTNFMDLKAMERNRERENLMLHKQGKVYRANDVIVKIHSVCRIRIRQRRKALGSVVPY